MCCYGPALKKKPTLFWCYGHFRTRAGIRCCWKGSANTAITSAAAPPPVEDERVSKQPKQVAASVSLMREWPQLSLSKPVLSSVTLRTNTDALSFPELNSFELRGGNMAELWQLVQVDHSLSEVPLECRVTWIRSFHTIGAQL